MILSHSILNKIVHKIVITQKLQNIIGKQYFYKAFYFMKHLCTIFFLSYQVCDEDNNIVPSI